MNTHNIVVIGAGYAGLMAAFRLATRARRRAQVTLVNASPTLVERVRLHQAAAGQRLRERPLAPAAARRGIEFVHGRVTALQLAAKTLTVQLADGPRTVAYDTLVYALGSTIERDRVPGVREHAYALAVDGPRGTDALGHALRALPAGASVTVVGGGLTGIEGVTEFAGAYPALRFKLVTRGIVGAGLSKRAREYILKGMARRRIDVLEHAPVTAVLSDSVMLDDGRRVPHDLVVWAGAFAVPPLARESGLAVNERGQVLVDETMRAVSHPDVYAVGDCAAAVTVGGVVLPMACQSALPQAGHAAASILARLRGLDPEPFRFGFVGQCISLGRRDAVLQFLRPDAAPVECVLTGRIAALAKELTSRLAASIAFMEGRFFHPYAWYKPRQVRPTAAHAPAR